MAFDPKHISDYSIGCLPKGRTDLLFLGMQGSGKSGMIGSVLRYMTDAGLLRYVPLAGADHSQPYHYDLMDTLDAGKATPATPSDALVPMQFDIGRRFKKPITVVDYSGKVLKLFSEAESVGAEAWNNTLGYCMKSDNPKTLLFLFDYSIISGRNPIFSAIDQEQVLDNILYIISSNGTGRYGDKGCTMEKVRNAAVIVTKSDLMETDLGCPLTHDEKVNYAFEYLKSRCSSFMNHLGDLCHKFDINANIKSHPHQVWITTFSLGRPASVGEADARRIADFIEAVTAKRRLFGGI